MRIDKLLEREKIGSRRQVKKLIRSKQVRVDGVLCLQEGQNVDPELQEITISGEKLTPAGHVYYLLNKPAGVVTAVKDSCHQTVLDMLAPQDRLEGIYPVGRLDRDTEGLLLLTDNGPLGYQLLLPEKHVVKVYEAVVNEAVTETDVQVFREGIIFHGGVRCQPAKLTILESGPQESRVRLAIAEGKFHQVKKMFLAAGKKVTYLKRISMGPLVLDDTLAAGAYRPLEPDELASLLQYFR